jgi:hypothetical protein
VGTVPVSQDFGSVPEDRTSRRWYCDVGGTRVELTRCREVSELLGTSSGELRVGECEAVWREGCSPYNYPLSRIAATRCECVEA